jgi:hypothetical protein
MRPTLPVIALLIASPAWAGPPDPARLSARIDELVAEKLARAGVPPAPPADDAEFFRRLCLDLTGRIPSLAQARDFLEDDRPDKRRLWADELLDGPDFLDRSAAHAANYWRSVLLAQASPEGKQAGARIEDWLRPKLRANIPYDKLVRGLLTDPGANAYYTAFANKAEDVAGSTARLLLGVRLECAQCHDDRSGGPWKQEQFWQYAAFFSRLPGPRIEGNRAIANAPPDDGPPRIKVAGKETTVEAKYLDAAALDWKKGSDPRAVLADWVTRPDNPWFARAAANRVWHSLVGTGLVDPVDGFGANDNPPSHPALLDELAKAFAASGYDLKFLTRAVVGSKTYQRTSRQTHPGQADPRLFARMPVRGLTAEQLFDSRDEATGYAVPTEAVGNDPLRRLSPRAKFLTKFQTHPDQPTEGQTSIQQALYLMNGDLTAAAGSLGRSKTLAAVAGSSAPAARQVEELFLVVLSRPPTDAEAKRFAAFVESGGPAKDRKQAIADVFWALLNSTEFAVNH